MPDITTAQLQALNQPIEANAPDAVLNVSFDPAKPLKVGTYTFQLEVVDDSGNRSAPATLKVTIFDNQAPTAVIDITAPQAGVPRVPFGVKFALTGAGSTDVGGGTVVKYIWTRTS